MACGTTERALKALSQNLPAPSKPNRATALRRCGGTAPGDRTGCRAGRNSGCLNIAVSQKRRSPSSLLPLLMSALVLVAGCSPIKEVPKGEDAPPCGKEGASRVELGPLFANMAQFETTGGKLYATAYDLSHGGAFDPKVGQTRLYIGEEATDGGTLPDPPPGTMFTKDVVEDKFVEFELPAGSYWLATTNAARIAVVSCSENGVSLPAM